MTRFLLASTFVIFAIAKLTSGPVAGSMLGDSITWSAVIACELLCAALLAVPRLSRCGLWLTLVFAVAAMALSFLDRPCGCGGLVFTMGQKWRFAVGAAMGALACWSLSKQSAVVMAPLGAETG